MPKQTTARKAEREITLSKDEFDCLRIWFEVGSKEIEDFQDSSAPLWRSIAHKSSKLRTDFTEAELKLIIEEAKHAPVAVSEERKLWEEIARKAELVLSRGVSLSPSIKGVHPLVGKSTCNPAERIKLIKDAIRAASEADMFVTLSGGKGGIIAEHTVQFGTPYWNIPSLERGCKQRVLTFLKSHFRFEQLEEGDVYIMVRSEDSDRETRIVDELFTTIFGLSADYRLTVTEMAK